MSKIKDIKAREILDSRGTPTVEVEVTLENDIKAVASVPSGASTGEREALELRDNDERYNGKGVLKAVSHVNNEIKEKLVGMSVENQKTLDEAMIELDGTDNKSKLGANAILGVSLACLKAAAKCNNKEVYDYLNKRERKIPYPMLNIVNGGAHASNNIDIQEFMIVPKLGTIKESLRAASEIFSELKKLLKEKNLSTGVGDEGGFAPDLENNKEALDFIVNSIEKAGYKPGKDVFIALDVAASTFYDKKKKIYTFEGKEYTTDKMLAYFEELVKEYPIISIEDPFDEYDEEGFIKITEKLGNKINIVGDDLFVTNKKLLQNGIDKKMCNSILIKPNQIGTFYEMLETIFLAKKHKYTPIISHRSGETTDTYIADFAVALNIPFIKTGSITRGERICKYNRLMYIDEKLTNK